MQSCNANKAFTSLLIVVTVVTVSFLSSVTGAQWPNVHQNQLQHPHYQQHLPQQQKQLNVDRNYIGRYQKAPAGRLVVLDKYDNQINLIPGLLDETLLKSGSFSFGAKTVTFDKLKVLGNIYVNHINGRSLREAYLLKSSLGAAHKRQLEGSPPTGQSATDDSKKPLDDQERQLASKSADTHENKKESVKQRQ